jgi:hypothetical protein
MLKKIVSEARFEVEDPSQSRRTPSHGKIEEEDVTEERHL